MSRLKLKESVKGKKKNNIYFLLDEKNKIRKYKPWLGDLFSFLYDRIMEKSVFPKKFSGSITKHFDILKNEFKDIVNKEIIDIAAGSGNAVKFLNRNNNYTGIDISAGLIKRAVRNFEKYNFANAEFYISDASDIPFSDNIFNIAICNLSLNFFTDIENFIKELKRVLRHGAVFYCSIPVPEKKKNKATIHGRLYSEEELKKLFNSQNFIFETLPYENGVLLYFKAKVNKK